uniref:choice-of-anchor I family protein n=1 Tax=unclassified Microbacterium TaxID=2609290 RepID=UPI003016876F
MPPHVRKRTLATLAAAALAGSLAVVPTTAATAAVVPSPPTVSADDAALALTPLGSYETGIFDQSAAEIVQPYGGRLFVVNAQAGAVDVLDAADPSAMTKLYSLSSDGVANSVAIRADGLGVAAFEAPVKTDAGHLVFFDAGAQSPAVLGTVTVGALPDMVTFSPDGGFVVVANEGEPADDFSSDPEGSVSVVSAPATVAAPAQSDVRTADFHAFEGDARPAGVRVFGPRPHGDDLPVSRNLEPEYITVQGDTAYVSLQEANALATVDLAAATVSAIHPLGAKDHGLARNALDPSDKDDVVELRTYDGLKGLYMPDGIASYTADGATYLVTANEGDAREWGDYEEGARVKDLGEDGLAPVCADSPLAGALDDADLGRLNVTTEDGLDADAGCYRELYAFGGRSFSIWSTDGALVWDSGSSFEEITRAAEPEHFNANHTSSDLEARSDDKGPEPESVVVGSLGGRTYAFVGFERVGGIAAYDVTDPSAPAFVTYVNNRDFSQSGDENLAGAGDLGPEGLAFIDAEHSPTGRPLLAVGNEVSGTTTLFSIDQLGTTELTVLGVNDFHGRIDANTVAVAGTVEEQRAAAPGPVLFLSSGDNIGASLFASSVAKDQPTIDVLNTLGLQATAVGNHEFDRGFADLTGRVTDTADYPQLGANVYHKGTTTPALPEYRLLDADGLTIGIIGAVTQETPSLVSPAGITDIDFGDPVQAVNRVAVHLTDGDPANGEADVLVALYHDGAGAGTPDGATLDQETAAGGAFAALVTDTAPSVDAIFTGHTHKTYAWSAPIPGTDRTRPVVQTG